MKVLVIGGNRFFGKRLVQYLLAAKHDVTLLNRGNIDDGFGDKVSRIRMDRSDISKATAELNQSWDIVYDQVCYDARDAKSACEVFGRNVKKYIFTSTKSVYPSKGPLTESDFDPLTYKYSTEVTRQQDYGEAKRQAETIFFKHMQSPVTAVRFPIVLGTDDYTARLKFHVERIAAGKPIYFPNLDAKIAFINSEDAARFLFFLSERDFKGPINCCSRDPLTLRSLVAQIEEETKEKAVLVSKGEGEESPFGIETDWYMVSERAKLLGFECRPHSEWLPGLIEHFSREYLLSDLC
jgi:nucleoside-diphosphate-sugar epimerase